MIRDEITDALYIIFDVVFWLAIVSMFVIMGKNSTDVTYRLAADQRYNTTISQHTGEPVPYEGIPDGNVITYDGILLGSDIEGEILELNPSITVKIDSRGAGLTPEQLNKYRTTADGMKHLMMLIDENENYLREYTISEAGDIVEVNYIKQ